MERLNENLGLVKQPKLPGALSLDHTRRGATAPHLSPQLLWPLNSSFVTLADFEQIMIHTDSIIRNGNKFHTVGS